MLRTIEEINDKIRTGSVVVVTAEEIIGLAREKGIKKAARDVDVVTTGTFSPMCSSGAFFNIKQPKEKMKIGGGWITLNVLPPKKNGPTWNGCIDPPLNCMSMGRDE